jgi:kynurenine formamidase
VSAWEVVEAAGSNWDRWGAADQRGTLNLVDDDIRRRAAGLVRTGEAVSLSHDLVDMTRLMKRSGESLLDRGRQEAGPRWHSTVEHISLQFHGIRTTHLDAPAHLFWDGLAYNGVRPEQVSTEHGATVLSVTAAAEGLLTRGVLVDVPAAEGLDRLDPGTAVGADRLTAAATTLGVEIGPADAVFVRVGHDPMDTVAAAGPTSGLDASCVAWLAERDVALLGSDATNDVSPLVDDDCPLPIHVGALRNLGLWLVDNAALEQLAGACARQQRYDFMLTMAPLRLEAATGSPVNPVAVF